MLAVLMAFFLIFRMSALYKTVKNFGQAPKLLKLSAPVTNIQNRNLNLLEYQSKGLLQVGRDGNQALSSQDIFTTRILESPCRSSE